MLFFLFFLMDVVSRCLEINVFSDFSVSPRSKSFFFCFFWGTFIRLGALLGQGLGLRFGPGLDNYSLEIGSMSFLGLDKVDPWSNSKFKFHFQLSGEPLKIFKYNIST